MKIYSQHTFATFHTVFSVSFPQKKMQITKCADAGSVSFTRLFWRWKTNFSTTKWKPMKGSVLQTHAQAGAEKSSWKKPRKKLPLIWYPREEMFLLGSVAWRNEAVRLLTWFTCSTHSYHKLCQFLQMPQHQTSLKFSAECFSAENASHFHVQNNWVQTSDTWAIVCSSVLLLTEKPLFWYGCLLPDGQ